jgi:hypothetical protein
MKDGVIHFTGFKDDRYLSAVRVFGLPDFIHCGWDLRARREIASSDATVFAEGSEDQEPRRKSYTDIKEETDR